MQDVHSGQPQRLEAAHVTTSTPNPVDAPVLSLEAGTYEESSALPRTRRRDAYRTNKAKRLAGLYNDQYRRLYNEVVQEIGGRDFNYDSRFVPLTQVGVSVWTSEEKGTFFAHLPRLGKSAVKALASKIATKGEVEVRDYIALLQDGLEEKMLNERPHQQLGLSDVPAAFEISKQCRHRLGRAAEALAWRQELYEADREKSRHSKYWLLNQEIAEEVEARLIQEAESDSPGKAEGSAERYDRESQQDSKLHQDELGMGILEHVPTARLFRLKAWLRLSEHIFMNPASPRDRQNWRSFAEPGEKPSIFHTAFADFHNLALSITQRIVQTSLSLALSRIRSKDRVMKRTLEPRVLRKDVLTALSVLGMNRSSERFWAETPRRCNLRVYARVRDVRLESDRGPKSKTRGVELSLKEVESFLGTDAFEAVMEEAPASPSDEEFDNDSSDAPSDQGGDPDGHPSNTQLSVDEDIDPKHAGMSPRRRLHRKRKRDEEELYAKYDDYVDEIDKKASDREERRMWEMLGQQPREGLKPEELLSSKAAPFLGRPASDSRDWRDHVDYRSEWEQFGGPVLRGSFTHARRTVDKVSRKPNLPSPARTRKPTVAAVRMDYAHGGSSNEKIEEVDSIDSLVPPDHADNEADPPSPANGEDSDPQDSDISMEELPEESEDEELDDNLASPQANYDELDSAPGVSSGDSEISDEDNQDKEVGLTGRDAGAPL